MRRHVLPRAAHSTQCGSFLLEALVAVLIIALGVLGSVGLLAKSMQETGEARNRAEAAALANGLVSEMWMTDRLTTTLQTDYNSTPGTGTGYTDFKALVASRLPNTAADPPEIDVQPGPVVPSNPALQTSSMVTIRIFWRPPGDSTVHQYNIIAAIGANS